MRYLLVVLSLWSSIGDLDRAAVREVQAARRPGLESVMHAVTNLGRKEIVFGGLLAIAILDPIGVATARVAVVSLLATNAVVDGTKFIVDRTRPDGDRNRTNSSFPSGHAASAVALALVFSKRWPRVRLLPWLIAALVCFSRIYLNRHYPSDVLVAGLIGYLVTVTVLKVAELRGRRVAVNRHGAATQDEAGS